MVSPRGNAVLVCVYAHALPEIPALLLWTLTLLTSLGVAGLLVELYETSSTAQMQRAEAVAARACGLIGDRFAFYAAGWNGVVADIPGFGRELTPVVIAALAHQPGVEGGIWSSTAGSLAYVGPALAEMAILQAANADAAVAEQIVLRRTTSGSQTAILAACPLAGPLDGLTAWALTRVPSSGGFDSLRAGLALLGALVLLIAGGVTWLTVSWGRHVRRIEMALQLHDIENLPRLPPTGERELDRVVAALNAATDRVAQGRARAAELAGQVAAAEHLAALGRVAAGVAHEIRNPIAAMRLRAENALAGDPARLRPALQASLDGIGRVDRLVAEMLAMSQRRTPVLTQVDVASFLQDRAAVLSEQAASAGIEVELEVAAGTARFDAELVGRAIDNLLLNALQHTPPNGRILLSAWEETASLHIAVADTGPGVDPALRYRLFEPFATGRPDGTGLGLAIAREMAEAHGGQLGLAERPGFGAVFELRLPR